jgi:hypothetical protein
MRRKFRKRTSLRSERSTLKGLLYADWRSHCKAFVQWKVRTIALERSVSETAVIRQATINFYSRVGNSFGDSILGLYCVAWLTQESVSSRIFVRKKGMSHVQSKRMFTADAFHRRRKREKSAVVMLQPDSHERLALEKPKRSVPETWGCMYNVLVLRN